MDLNKLTKKELVEHGKSLGLSLNINDKKEVLISQIKKIEPWWALPSAIVFCGALIYGILPIVLAIIVTCFIVAIYIEYKITSDINYTGWAAVIAVVFFFYSGAAVWDWEQAGLIGWDWRQL